MAKRLAERLRDPRLKTPSHRCLIIDLITAGIKKQEQSQALGGLLQNIIQLNEPIQIIKQLKQAMAGEIYHLVLKDRRQIFF